MNQQLTPNEVAANLAGLARQLDAAVRDIDRAEQEAVNAREDYTLVFSRAYLAAEGSIENRKHLATVETHEARLAAETAEQVVRGLRRQIDTIKVRIDVGRSLGAAVRAELSTLGGVA